MANRNTIRESKIDARIRAEVKRKGGQYIKLATNYQSKLPDRLVLLADNNAFFVETKAFGKSPDVGQARYHAKLRALGHTVIVPSCPETLHALLETIRNSPPHEKTHRTTQLPEL